MPRIDNPPPPFENYACYKNYHAKMQRDQVCLVPLDLWGDLDRKGTRKTITYAKFLMCVKLGRILGPDEQVDHIDNNKTDDDIDNLQVLTPKEHTRKTAKEQRRLWTVVCPTCKESFDVKPAHIRWAETHSKAKAKFCSRVCAVIYQMNNKAPLVKR